MRRGEGDGRTFSLLHALISEYTCNQDRVIERNITLCSKTNLALSLGQPSAVRVPGSTRKIVERTLQCMGLGKESYWLLLKTIGFADLSF